jgi:hypothetical protein
VSEKSRQKTDTANGDLEAGKGQAGLADEVRVEEREITDLQHGRRRKILSGIKSSRRGRGYAKSATMFGRNAKVKEARLPLVPEGELESEFEVVGEAA